MAASVAMQLLLASPLSVNLTKRSRAIQFSPVKLKSVPCLQRNSDACVRCLAEGEEEEHLIGAPKAGTNFSDVLFSGAVAERINGRVAMIGLVATMAVELSKGQDLFSQISDGGIPWLLGSSNVITVASLIPLFEGVKVESSSVGFFASDAELRNGRFAMLGFLALAFIEYLKVNM